jgi:uncharacterized protein YecT (DUF1311 family)
MEDAGMKRMTWIVLGWLLLGITAQAASFDCARAATKVEKLICADAEISKLDEELNTAYKTALKDGKAAADSIKQEQKQWMKGRNGCADAICVKSAYEVRLRAISVNGEISPQTAQSQKETAGGFVVGKKYPPYPDVWEMQVPVYEKEIHPRVGAVPLDSGDVGIGYFSDKGDKRAMDPIRDKNFTWITFFDRQTTASPIVANGLIRFSDGSVVRPMENMPDHFPGTAELKDGSYMVSSQSTFWRGCYQGPAANKVTRYQSKIVRKPLQRSRVVFLLLNDPVTISTGSVEGLNRPAACEAAEKEITTRVVSLSGEVIPLEDGGFLLADENYGWVIRFDANLNTQSKLLNKRLFVFEVDTLDVYFIEKITGRKYMDEHGYTKMQQVNDDLYAYLSKLNMGDN